MRVPVLACAALGAFASVADGAADYSGLPDWENPYVTSSNRLPARAVFVPASSLEEAVDIAYLRKPRTASKWVLSLDGEWNFEWQPWPEGYRRVEHVERVDEKKSGKIIVPGCWQLQGDYDPPIYTNVRFPHVKNPPYVMQEPPTNYTAFVYRNPVGTYRREFTVPKEWEGRRVVLHFGGVYSAFYVRVNGVEVGYSEDSRLPAEFDVTEFLSAKNEIEVEVYRWCDGSYLEDQDFWRLADFYDSFQGGYIWDFADQGLLDKDGRLKYGGDFGDVPNDGNGNCNGLVDPLRNPHPGAYEVAYVHGLFPNSYPDTEAVKLAPLLADLKVEPCFARPRTDNDNGSKQRRCDGTAKFRRIPIDAHAHIGVEG